MHGAVDRIEAALTKGETIGIFGDYDADGITGTAQLVRFFRRRGTEAVVFLPSRLLDGYGLKEASVDEIAAKGVTLLITVDTGVTAHAEIAALKAKGVDVIVTDHHRPRGGRPPAFAVIHPAVPSAFPNAHLSGSGVAFMLVRALEGLKVWEGVGEDTVLAMIGTVGDVVPLTGENRLLVFHGLKAVERLSMTSPLRAMFEAVRSSGRPLTSGDIAFRIVPRINAAGRLEHPSLALHALLGDARALERLHELNAERQTMVEELLEIAVNGIDSSKLFLTFAHERFTPGVVGLIAGRLTEMFHRPSLVASIENGLCTGSLRSIPGVDVLSCLEHPSVQRHLIRYGGHAQAAGCTIAQEHFSEVSAGLITAMNALDIHEDLLTPSLSIEAEVPGSEVKMTLAKHLLSLEPFGAQNPEPLFLLSRQRLLDARAVGAEGRHLQCRVGPIKAIGFGLGHLAGELSSSVAHDVACSVSINAWNGREEVQLVVKDVRVNG